MVWAVLNLSFSHMVLIGIVALIFIGPQQLPEVARNLARFINELKRIRGDLSQSLWSVKDQLNTKITLPPSEAQPKTEPQPPPPPS